MVLHSPFPFRSVSDLPGYRLVEKIGEGGTGKVYRAIRLDSNQPVAIKFLGRPVDGQAPEADLRRESELMSALRHPHVVWVYDWGVLEGKSYLVMEYVEGVSLRAKMLPGKPWSPRAALPVVTAIADALSYIHGQGILHLDLKPENVLCGSAGEIKITDFGLAVPHLDAKRLAELELVQGTIDYCAPEQRYGLPLDQRTDLFALAVLCFELLTGQLPGRVYVPASRHNRRLHAGVDAVLARGLARDADDRPAAVAEWSQELCSALGRRTWRFWRW